MRLYPCPASLVVRRRRRQGDQAPFFEEWRDRVWEEDLGSYAVRFVLFQTTVRVPAPVGGRREQICKGIDI